MKDFLVFCASIEIGEGLQSGMALWLELTGHKSHLVHFKHGLEQIFATVIKGSFELMVARIVMESTIMQMGLTDFHWTSLVA